MSNEDDEGEERKGPALPSLADIRRLLLKRKLIVGFATLLCGAASLGLLLTLTPQYLATATVAIDPRDHNVANMKEVTSDLVANTPSIESEAEIIHSTEVAGRVIDELRLSEDNELAAKPRGLLVAVKALIRPLLGKSEAPAEARNLIEATAESAPRTDSLIEGFLKNVSAERVRETFLIQIGYRSRDPVKAARIANAIAEAYVREQVETKERAAEQATSWLQRQIADLRDKVFTAEKAIADFRGAHGLYDTEGQPLDEREVGRQMEQLTLARNTSAETRAKYEHAKQLLDSGADIDTVGDVLKATAIVALKEQYADALRQQAAAATKYGPLHPAMLKANSQVQSAKVELRAEIERIITNLKSEADVAASAEAQLEANLTRLKASLSGDRGEVVRLKELEREAAAAREVYESFLKRAQETTQQQNLQAPDAHIVDRAGVPTVTVAPKKTLIVAGGFGGGLVLGLILAVLIELTFPSFVRTEAIEARFKLRHLATIERFNEESGERPAPLEQLRRIVLDPSSVFSEQIRSIRVAVERQRKTRATQIVLVTSAVPLEGKSLLASNLALHFALSGVRTLLIDCDFASCGLTSQLSPDASPTLYGCVMARKPLQRAIMRESATGLHFLPGYTAADLTGGAEAPAVTPSDLFASPSFAAALQRLRSEFEIIVLDPRAIVPSVDARILAEIADQIVFVTKWRETPPASARQALRALAHSLVKVTGVVVNQVDHDALGNEAPLQPEPARAAPPPRPRLA